MLMNLFFMVFSLSGGLYLGTIVFSAYKFAEFEKAIAHIFSGNDLFNLA